MIVTSCGFRSSTARPYARCSASSSRSRPTKACRSPPTPRGRISESARTSRRQATPPAFPFASTVGGSPNSNAPPTAATVRSPTRISPGSAACSSRAATLTASPVTNELPSRGCPTTTSPVFTPMRSDSAIAEQLLEPPLHRQRGVQRALCVILLRGRRTEGRHHGIADELLDRAAGAGDLGRHRVVEAVQQGARSLRILRTGELRRAHQVGEQHGGELPLLARPFRLGNRDRTRATRTETSLGRQRRPQLGQNATSRLLLVCTAVANGRRLGPQRDRELRGRRAGVEQARGRRRHGPGRPPGEQLARDGHSAGRCDPSAGAAR